MIADLKPYETYADSSLTWAGSLPSAWRTERGKCLFRKMDRPVRPEDQVVTCFRDGRVTLRSNRRTRGFTEALYEFGYQGIRRGDLVIHAMDAFAGAIGVSDSDGKGTPVYAVCQPRPGVNAHYYAYVIREMARSQWIMALSRGIRERSTDFRYDTFGTQFVPLPPPDEQDAIVRFLGWATSRLDRAIRAKRKVIALLSDRKQAIIHQAVTRGFNDSVRLRPSGIPWLGDIPEHWEIRRIKYLIREVDKRSTTGLEPLLSMRRNHGLVIFAEHFSRPPQAATLVGFKIVRPGQFVINRMQAGNGVIFASTLIGLVSPDYAVFDPIGNANVDFLGELFRSRNTRAKFRAESKGLGTGSSGFLRLYNDRLGSIHVALPSLAEQHSILEELGRALSGVNSTITQLEQEVDLLREYRTRLVSDVVTGKLDVREAAMNLPDEVPAEATEDVDLDEGEFEEEEVEA